MRSDEQKNEELAPAHDLPRLACASAGSLKLIFALENKNQRGSYSNKQVDHDDALVFLCAPGDGCIRLSTE
jgi:hypothetical protein